MAIFPPPPVQGLGTVGGFKLYLEDRGGAGFEDLYAQLQAGLAKGQTDAVAGRTVFQLPGQRAADRRQRRSRAREELRRAAHRRVRDAAGLSRLALRQRLQPLRPHLSGERAGGVRLPSAAGADSAPADAKRPWRDGAARVSREGDARLRTRSGDALQRLSRRGDQRRAGTGISSGQAQAAIADVLDRQLPSGMSFEWTELAYQELLAGNTMLFIFPLCVLLVYSCWRRSMKAGRCRWRDPHRADVLFSAIAGVWLTGGDINVFTQIGFSCWSGSPARTRF